MNASLLFVAPSAYPLGGVATWFDYLVPGLKQRGWTVTVALTAGRWHDARRYLAEHPALTAITIDNPTGSREGRVNAIMQVVRRLRPDVVLAVNIIDCHEAVRRIRHVNVELPTRLLMTLHGIQPDLFEDVERERDVLDGVACSNKLAIELARRAGVAGDRLHYLPYGVAFPTVAPITRRRRLSGEPLRIGYVGRIEQWQKRVHDLAGICDSLVQRGLAFELWIAGGGPDEASLRQRLEAHSDVGRVRWLGHVPADEVAQRVYAQIDVLVNPSFWETGPIVVWEAMAHGVAVASSRYVGSGLESALADQVNCMLFDIGDATGAADAIYRLAEPQLFERLTSAAYSLVAERYGIGASIDRWETAIREVLSAQRLIPVAPTKPTPAGRLDRALGVARGELVRRVLRLAHDHVEPGGEWPHSYGRRTIDDPAFWIGAASADHGQRHD